YLVRLAGYSDVTQYSWSYDRDDVTFSQSAGGIGENETRITFGKRSIGTGTLTVSLEHPCGVRELIRTVEVNYPTGTEDVTDGSVRVYPNPTSGLVNVTNTHSGQPIRVTGVTGAETRTYPAREGVTTIDLAGYARGVYVLQYGGKSYKVIRK
ncbi:MAG: T9SS type A sorting domain-containing protein, partial [Dysgonamonadaceae bacterium]|nr:T9SS type A sorting domain-containing protein [Dysgonamonadaceae bacterium]